MFTDTHISSLGNVGRTIWRLQKLILGFKGASSSVVSCVKILWMQFVGNYILAINTDYIQMILHMNTSKCVRGGTPVIYLWTLGFYFTISITGLLSSCTDKTASEACSSCFTTVPGCVKKAGGGPGVHGRCNDISTERKSCSGIETVRGYMQGGNAISLENLWVLFTRTVWTGDFVLQDELVHFPFAKKHSKWFIFVPFSFP